MPESWTTARIRRLRLNLSLRGVIIALAVGVIVPVLLSTAVGIVSLALGEKTDPLVVAVLVVSFAATAIGGAVTATVLLGRRARLARQQADLLANVSHELRTPLTTIRMYAQTLLGGQLEQDPQRARDSLEVIVRESRWLDATIERVLGWRAAAKDRPLLQLETAPVGPALEEASQRFETMVDPRSLDFEVELQSRSPVVHDRAAIATIALNLLINAYKYTGADKRIALRTRDVEDAVEIEVEDDGVGIAAEEQVRIFKPFYRVEGGAVGRAPGAGLGLAIVWHLVEGHAGRVRVDSTPGHGSRFIVRLPRAPAGGTR